MGRGDAEGEAVTLLWELLGWLAVVLGAVSVAFMALGMPSL
jgi:hypothetical protein